MFLILGHSCSNLFLVFVVFIVTCFSSCWVLYGEQLQGGDGPQKSVTLSSFIYATTVLKPYEWRYISGNLLHQLMKVRFFYPSFAKGFWFSFLFLGGLLWYVNFKFHSGECSRTLTKFGRMGFDFFRIHDILLNLDDFSVISCIHQCKNRWMQLEMYESNCFNWLMVYGSLVSLM